VAGVVQYASPVLQGRTIEVDLVDPVQPELNGTLTNRFGGNAFFVCLFPHLIFIVLFIAHQ
jgi:hypothetical protein